MNLDRHLDQKSNLSYPLLIMAFIVVLSGELYSKSSYGSIKSLHASNRCMRLHFEPPVRNSVIRSPTSIQLFPKPEVNLGSRREPFTVYQRRF